MGPPLTAAIADHGRLDWTPRRRLTTAQAKRRTVALKAFRVACMVLCVLCVASVFVSAVTRSMGRDLLGEGGVTADSPRMINPRFTGRAGGDSSYVLTATSALRRSRDANVIDLDKPAYRTPGGLTITAPAGIYDPDNQTLELTGGVIFTDADGNQFTTPHTKLDAASNLASGAMAVQGAGPLGSVRADNYEIDAKTGHVRMSGRVSGTLKD